MTLLRRSWAGWVLAAIVATSTTALAEPYASHTVRDEPYLKEFRIESATPGGTVCVMLPAPEGDCGGFEDTSRAAASAKGMMLEGSTVIAMATIREPVANVRVLVYRHALQGKNLEAEVLDGILKGMGKAIADRPGTVEVEPPHRVSIAGHEGLRVVVEQPGQEVAVRTTLVGLFGAEQLHVFMFLAPAPYAQEASRTIDHMLGTLSYEPGELGSFGRSRKELQQQRFGSLVKTIGIPALIAAVVYLVLKRRKAGA